MNVSRITIPTAAAAERALSRAACIGVLAIGAAVAAAQSPIGTEFNYQGRLRLAGMDVNDTADFEFTLWRDAVSLNPGDVAGSTVSKNNVDVMEGVFSVELDFGVDPFDGQALWLEIAVRSPAGGGAYTTLSPRQPITAAPYALALRGIRTNAGVGFDVESWNIQGGHALNVAASGLSGTTMFGGSTALPNEVRRSYCTISGGEGNIAGGDSSEDNDATVGGGRLNAATGNNSTVAGGNFNQALADNSAIGGGNSNSATGGFSTIGGGFFNAASANSATVPGGLNNEAGGSYSFAAGRAAVVRNATQSGDSDGDEGTFVWADSAASDFISTGPNQFLVRAAGGVGIGTNEPDAGIFEVQQLSDTPLGGIAVSSTFDHALRLWVDENAVSHIDTNWYISLNSGPGRVGVGTVDPAGPLHVVGDDVPQLIVHQSASNGASGGIAVRGSRFASTPDVDVAYLDLRDFDETEGGGTDFAMARVAAGQQTTSGQTGLLRFSTNNGTGLEERMRITSAGRVGMGTNGDPVAFLEVVESQSGQDTLQLTGSVAGANPNLRLEEDGGASANIRIAENNGNALEIQTADNPRMTITQSGNVGIGTTTPGERLHVVGNICATGTIGACSDERFKENVASLRDALATLAKLRGVSFDWKRNEFPDRDFSHQHQLGFIAQELADVLPEVVSEGSDGYYSVDYGRLTPVLVEAVKELDAQNREKDARINELSERVNSIEQRIESLNDRKEHE